MEVTLMAFLGWGFVITPIIMILSTASPVGLVAELVLGFMVVFFMFRNFTELRIEESQPGL